VSPPSPPPALRRAHPPIARLCADSQPVAVAAFGARRAARQRYGLLEKRKDYQQRARDYHRKEKALQVGLDTGIPTGKSLCACEHFASDNNCHAGSAEESG